MIFLCHACLVEQELYRSVVLSWFKSFLSGWSSQVDISGELSSPKISDFGLPQGSVVGPTGFSIHFR